MIWLVDDRGNIAAAALSYVAQLIDASDRLSQLMVAAIFARTWCWSYDHAAMLARERKAA